MGQEIERRFVVTAIDPEFRRRECRQIRQGYLDTMPGSSFRVRLTDDSRYTVTHKRGTGLVRREDEFSVEDPVLGRKLMECCEFFLEKTRHLWDGWEIDVYHGPLTGLIIAEREMASVDENVELPSWIKEAHEVTDSVNNLVLARTARLLSGYPATPKPIRDHLPRHLPLIVITGGPGSGKSSGIEALRRDPEIASRVAFVPEAATIVIAQVGLKPPPQATDPVGFARFQQTLARVQMAFEEGAADQALRDGKTAVVLDRGLLDSAAYLAGGLEEFEKLTGLDTIEVSRRYHAVIELAVAPPDVFDEIRKNNEARSETYDEAARLGERIHQSWDGMVGLHFRIGNEAEGWNHKLDRILFSVRTSLDALKR